MPLPFSFEDVIARRKAAEEAKYPSVAGLSTSLMGLAGAPLGTAPAIPSLPSMRFIPKESIIPREPETSWGDVGTGIARGFGRALFEAPGMLSNLAGLATKNRDFMWLGKELQDEGRRQFQIGRAHV